MNYLIFLFPHYLFRRNFYEQCIGLTRQLTPSPVTDLSADTLTCSAEQRVWSLGKIICWNVFLSFSFFSQLLITVLTCEGKQWVTLCAAVCEDTDQEDAFALTSTSELFSITNVQRIQHDRLPPSSVLCPHLPGKKQKQSTHLVNSAFSSVPDGDSKHNDGSSQRVQV